MKVRSHTSTPSFPLYIKYKPITDSKPITSPIPFLSPTIPSMSASLFGSSILPKTSHSRCHRQALKTIIAACIHSSRTEITRNPLSCDSDGTQLGNSSNRYVHSSRPNFLDVESCSPLAQRHQKTVDTPPTVFPGEFDGDKDDIWLKLREEAESDVEQEPILANYYFATILSHTSLERALANHLAIKLSNSILPFSTFSEVFLSVFMEDPEIRRAIRDDLHAVKERDPACISFVHCLLNFKGFLACQAHRVAHKLWSQGRKVMASLIQNRVSEVFAVDIHPGAKIGSGILLDHATGVVIGETAVIGNNVSILHSVTLGGTGKIAGDRHPKIGDGVLVGAGTHVLGNVRIGEGAKIGAGSVVLKEVPPRTTAVGNPAKLIGGKENPIKLDKIPSLTMDHTSWSDYVI